MGCRLSIDGGVDSKNYLFHLICRNAINEACEIKVLWAYAVKRRQGPAQHMIPCAERSGAFERPKVGDSLDDDQRVTIALFFPAQGAGIPTIQIAAGLAGHDSFTRRLQRVSERRQKVITLANEMQRR